MIKWQTVALLLFDLMLTAVLIGTAKAAITGFNSPYDVAVAPNGNYLYVTNYGNNTVSIVSTATNSIDGTITCFNRPAGLAFTTNGTFAYVTDLSANELTRISTATNTITKIIGGFNRPRFVSLSPNGNIAYVTNQGNDTVSMVNLTSNPALSMPTITPSSAIYDLDQNISFRSSWSGGSPLYTENWMISKGPSISNNTSYAGLCTLSNTISISASSLGIGNYAVNSVVSDGSSPMQTSNSMKSAFSINSALNPENPTPASAKITSGQSVTLTANPTGGTPPYSYQWYVSLTPVCNSASPMIGTGPSVSVGPSSSTYYCYTVTDNATTPTTKTSGAELVTVTSAGLTNSGGGGGPGGSSGLPTVAQSGACYIITNLAPPDAEKLPFGSYGSYFVRLNAISPGSATVTIDNGTSYMLLPNMTQNFAQVNAGNFTLDLNSISFVGLFRYIVLTVCGPPSVKIQTPTVVTMSSNQTVTLVDLIKEQTFLNVTSMVPSKNEFIVLGIQAANEFSLALKGVVLNFVADSISPEGSVVTINNENYTLSLFSPVVVNQTKNDNYTITATLSNTTTTPSNTMAIAVRALPNVINITVANFTRNIQANQTLSGQNLTSSKLIPLLPPGYQKQLIQNISVLPSLNLSNNKVNTTTYAQIKYNCSIPFYEEVPLILSNYSWVQVSSFTVKPTGCIVTFSFGSDPTLALTRYQAPTKNTTTIPPPKVSTKLKSIILSSRIYYVIIALVTIILIAIIIVLYKRRKGEKSREKARVKAERKEKGNKKLRERLKKYNK